MRRITLWFMSTLSVLVLLFNYPSSQTSTVAATAPGVSATESRATQGESTSGTTDSVATTYAGDAVTTRYGTVQVQITVVGDRVTTAQALQVPTGNRQDQQINSVAVPTYNGEVIDAQSAEIDVVSGATVTWGGYTESLQSALDQAHL